MKVSALILACHLAGALAAPAPRTAIRRAVIEHPNTLPLGPHPAVARSPRNQRRAAAGAGAGAGAVAAAEAAPAVNACPAPTAGKAVAAGAEGEAGAEGAAAENEVLIDAVFGQTVALEGGDVKQDVLYPAGPAGAFEVEFQSANAGTVAVTENKTPAAPPAGFAAVEPSSFVVQLAGGAPEGITLQKIDYFFDVNNPQVAALDLATTQIGKLSADGCSFAIEQGELEFEAEENELTLTVSDLNGEWGIFIPVAGGAAAAEAGAGAAVDAANAADAAGVGAAAENEVLVNGAFDAPVAVGGGNVKTDILFPGNAAGEFEVEYNGTAANAITVTQNAAPANPPAGFLFVDPTTFVVSTQNPTDPATDTVKIDYFYSEAVKATIDVNQGVIGKLDAASGTFVTEGLGEFEIELEENEWTLTVADLNGEWAMLVPQTALLARRAR